MLAARTSCRHFSGDAISGEHISALLSSAVGSPSFDPECRPKPLLAGGPVGHRGYPSGGALYFVEVLVALLHVEGATCGIYNYQPLPHRLAVRRAPLTPQAIAEQFANEHLEDASLILLFFLDFTRVSFAKYSLKSYRLALLEAGHLAQNTVLTAAGLGLSSVPICGFDDRCLTEMAGLRYPEQPVIYAVAVGEAAKKSNL
jgi:SagB-type dehydrogenase family enzyme